MERRSFLKQSVMVAGLGLGGTGLLYGRRSYARNELVDELVDDALPELAALSHAHISKLPSYGREEIRKYFHQKCLNTESFAQYITSDSFNRRLDSCSSMEAKQVELTHAFCERIATQSEITNSIHVISTEIGQEIDIAWSQYCRDLNSRWDSRAKISQVTKPEDFSRNLTNLVRTEMISFHESMPVHQRPTLSGTVISIGTTAIELLPLAKYGKIGALIALPLFIIKAINSIWEYVMGQITSRKGEYQATISKRLAEMGNRVGMEYETEIRLRLADLHTWQENSVYETASTIASKKIRLF